MNLLKWGYAFVCSTKEVVDKRNALEHGRLLERGVIRGGFL